MTSSNVDPATARARWIEDAERLDLAIYAAIARTPTPALDVAMSRLSRAADYSRLSLASAALLALSGGSTGRRAATMGLASLGVTATVVNVAVKPLARRRRPDRLASDVPLARHVRMPSSRSFPSGHAAALRLCDRHRPSVAGGRRPSACARRAHRLLAGPHRGALPRRRAGRRADRHRTCAAHHTRRRPPLARAQRLTPAPSRRPRLVTAVGGEVVSGTSRQSCNRTND